MAERKFTWFPKMTRILSGIPDEVDRCRLFMAIIEYGTHGIEPELEYPLCSIFDALRDDIDNSIDARERNKGGRPKKETTENGGFEVSKNSETGVSEPENGGFEVSKNSETPPLYTKPYQSIPNHTIPNQEIEAKRKRFAPPTRDEALDYAKQIGLPPGECDRFLDHFTANGWKVGGRTAMKDWKASMRNWQRNIPTFSPQSKEVISDEYSFL